MDLKETSLSSELVYDGKLLKVRHDVVRMPSGRQGWREWVEHPPGVIIVPLLSGPPDHTVLMLRHFRFAMQRVMHELPAGLMDKPGEEPQQAAARELTEETGFTAGSLQPMGRFYSQSGFSTDCAYFFLATDLREGAAAPEDDEHFEYVRLPLREAIALMMKEPAHDARTLLALLFAERRLTEPRRE